ncbi:MAG TPA: D-glycero-beta-D-manno-heptose-7-phosphate kinase [Candidatus Cloacimonadota bacterium]|nr:D-glycero-beta-D-manno-heptose-7-phosphate kinase [Candidatus Cloacimonadota bacterium]HQL14983.1 D-glycero-beta-D-manno-heptose-7-phosphate kinase [Candidatus Cloacimonadota bacterium]
MKNLDAILESFPQKRILVLGDIMLDHYIWGQVERISPEAPVPVLDVQKEEYRLGGAANVALNLQALNAEVILCGVIGKDEAGKRILHLLKQHRLSEQAILDISDRPTTRKTRIGAENQQIARIDRENRFDISAQAQKQILKLVKEFLPAADAVILEDYNKGLLTANLITDIIQAAKEQKKLITVDPKQRNFFQYKGVTVFKPNYRELQQNLGVIFSDEAEFVKYAKQLRKKLACRYLVVTRGEDGLYIFSSQDKMQRIPAFTREVYDVSGAGDTVISVLTLALCSGCDISTAAEIANHAAGIVCGKKGTASVTAEEIRISYREQR